MSVNNYVLLIGSCSVEMRHIITAIGVLRASRYHQPWTLADRVLNGYIFVWKRTISSSNYSDQTASWSPQIGGVIEGVPPLKILQVRFRIIVICPEI